MVCEECEEPIWEELDMTKEERMAFELGYSKGRNSGHIWLWILLWILIACGIAGFVIFKGGGF